VPLQIAIAIAIPTIVYRCRYERESKKAGKGSFAFAWVLDAHDEERARGVTMDVAVSHFQTEHRRITLLDAPGTYREANRNRFQDGGRH
jgi:translation elongation factor EF-1alpha